ncbi:MAG: type II toxin-antitoxin system RelE/ParE family toxin [Acidobacteria bacterium]|nr:type II toxin-antitoxin system RelE/ParE family toxin [Acidobacteriota bacterium]
MRERVVEAIGTLAERPDRGSLLKGDLAGLRKLRQGSYRIIYEVQPAQRRVLVLRVANRKDAYRRRG